MFLVVDLMEPCTREAGASLLVIIAAGETAGSAARWGRRLRLLLLTLLEFDAHFACTRTDWRLEYEIFPDVENPESLFSLFYHSE